MQYNAIQVETIENSNFSKSQQINRNKFPKYNVKRPRKKQERH